jgi:hypothetical protein
LNTAGPYEFSRSPNTPPDFNPAAFLKGARSHLFDENDPPLVIKSDNGPDM